MNLIDLFKREDRRAEHKGTARELSFIDEPLVKKKALEREI